MRIVEIIPLTTLMVECINDDDVHRIHYETYYRYSADDWGVRYGESIEPVWDSSKLEKLYQLYIKEINYE